MLKNSLNVILLIYDITLIPQDAGAYHTLNFKYYSIMKKCYSITNQVKHLKKRRHTIQKYDNLYSVYTPTLLRIR